MGSGDGGGINLNAARITLGGAGEVAARSTGNGAAGSILISATERFESRGGTVSTESESAGGGGITFRVGKLFHLADGAVTTSVRGGGGDAGNIDIDPRFVALNNGHISANAHGGAGGNIRIVSDYFLTSGASVVEASSALGVDGSVRIESVETQVTDGLEGPRAEYLDASALLRPRCAARAPGQASTFTVSGRGGPPPDPDRPAWSTYSSVIDPADKPDAGRDSVESRVELRADAACRG
jgi:large exoprotein involved in heme utilization and adhesion